MGVFGVQYSVFSVQYSVMRVPGSVLRIAYCVLRGAAKGRGIENRKLKIGGAAVGTAAGLLGGGSRWRNLSLLYSVGE
jgi:hypothetical protein